MTDRDDDEAATGVPERTERTERTESGRHVTESGRHLTNRNVVPRSAPGREDSGPREIRLAGSPNRPGSSDDAFEVVTPVRPEPRDVYDEADVTLSHSDEPDEPDEVVTSDPVVLDPHLRITPRLPPRRAPTERGHVEPRRRPTTPPALPRDPDPDAEPTDRIRPRLPTRKLSWQAGAESPNTHAAPPVALDRALRVITVLAVLGLGAAGLAQPGSVLRGGVAWLGFLFFVLAGWGTIVSSIGLGRSRGVGTPTALPAGRGSSPVGSIGRAGKPDIGLCAALGAAGYLAVAGVLIAAGVLTRPVILALIGLGFAGFAWREVTEPVATWHRIRAGLAFVRASPVLGTFAALLVALACVRLVGAVATLDRNPWDDDIAYTPFVKRLLDTGDLIEPFSFRRLGAYGGQTALHALGAARGSLASIHLIDKGLGLGVLLLVMLGHARERRTGPLWLGLAALVVVVLPETAINTASYWTGAMMFLALYRCIVREHWALVGVVAATTCTLRQNFLVTIAVLVASVLIARLVELARTMPLGHAWRQERRRWAIVAGAALVVIVPWWIAAYLSSQTFLFPIIDGTWNHALSLKPAVTTWPQELGFLVSCALDPSPIVVIPILALVVAFVTDRRPGRPLTALVIASALGFVLLVHGFLGTDAFNTWRYAFGFATTLAIALVLELGAEDDAIELAPPGRWIVLAALVLQLVAGRGAMTKRGGVLFDDLREAVALDRHGDASAGAEQRRYRAMQSAIPPGEHVVVMLDDAALLDHDRNRIANLDTPGFASPGEQLPAFRGAEPLRAYLVAAGYRYAAFVRSERSRYFFRRGFWRDRIFDDAELFQIMSAYAIDAIDNLAELATTTQVRYDADGLVVLDLASPLRDASRRAAPGDEPTRRAAWAKELADREHLHDAWSLSTRADLRFEDGTGALRYVDDGVDDPRWYALTHPNESAKQRTAVLPLQRRAHLRVRGATDMRLVLRATIALSMVLTHPRLDVSLDGALVASAVADAAGHYAIEAVVPRDRLAGGWHDLYLVFSSIGDPDRDLRDVRVARLEAIEWSPP